MLADLIRWADVFGESFSPGVIERMGFGYAAARATESADHHGQQLPARASRDRGATTPASATWPAPIMRFLSAGGPSGCAAQRAVSVRTRISWACVTTRSRSLRRWRIAIARRGPIHRHGASRGRAALRRARGTGLSRGAGRVPSRAAIATARWRRTASIRRAGVDRWVAIAVRTDDEWQRLALHANWPDLAADPMLATLEGRKGR